MKEFSSISKKDEFDKIYSCAKKWHNEFVVIYFLADEASKKFAPVASKKIGNAVLRNRAKRILRSAFFECQNNLANGAYVLIAKRPIVGIKSTKLQKTLIWSFKKIGSMK